MTALKFMDLLMGSFYGIFISAVLYTPLHSCAITTEKQLYSVFMFRFQARACVRQLYRTIHKEMYFSRIERVLKMYAR